MMNIVLEESTIAQVNGKQVVSLVHSGVTNNSTKEEVTRRLELWIDPRHSSFKEVN